VAKLKYLGKASTNQLLIHVELKNRSNSDNHSVHNLLSSHLLSKKVKIKICRIIIFSIVVYEYETWSLTLRE
jgi:hypothetical protein